MATLTTAIAFTSSLTTASSLTEALESDGNTWHARLCRLFVVTAQTHEDCAVGRPVSWEDEFDHSVSAPRVRLGCKFPVFYGDADNTLKYFYHRRPVGLIRACAICNLAASSAGSCMTRSTTPTRRRLASTFSARRCIWRTGRCGFSFGILLGR